MAGKGTASPKKLKKGVQWYAVYDGPPKADGGRRQIWEKPEVNTRSAAQRLATIRLAERHQDDWEHPHQSVVFGDLATRWFELDVLPRAAPNTIDAYKTWLTIHVLPYFGSLDARRLKSEDIQRFVAQKLGDKLAVGYVKQLVGQVKTVLRQGIEWGVLRPGSADFRVRYPRVQKEEIDPFTPQEIHKLLEAAKTQWRPMITLGIWSGMRQGELMAARWRYLDTEKQQYYVCQNITRRMAFGDVKGRNAAPVELSSFVMVALEDQRSRVARWQLGSEAWEDNDLIFPNSSTGKPWTHSYLRKVFADTCEIAGVRYRPPHNMRHTCASLLLHQGENLKLVSKQLRHADPKITLSTYAHLLPDAGQEALERLDAALLSASNNHLTISG
jgi:integrase